MKKPLKITLWVIGSLVVGFVALVVVGLWITGREYDFANGRTLQQNVSGRWDWSTRKVACTDSAHTIAFSADDKVMTITSDYHFADSTGKDWTVATYDIRSVAPSSIQGAIRGETRRTDSGEPVVWDLVVTGPDKYTWHRADWQSWMHTAEIRRCPPVGAVANASNTEAPPPPKPRTRVADFYRGTVLSHQLPDRPVPIELSIFQRSDSSISGWLESGAPLNIKGLTWVIEQGGDSLYLSTAASNGDTIVWASETRLGKIGGEYWVSAGPNIGKGGTWQLEPAARLSVTTLVLASALLGGALLLGIFAVAAYGSDRWWRWRDKRGLNVTPEERQRLGTFGGWLVLIVIGQSLVALVMLIRFREIGDGLGASWMLGAALAGMRPTLIVESAFHIVQLCGIIGGLVLMTRRSRLTPPYWTTFLVALAAYALFDLSATTALRTQMVAMFGSEAGPNFDRATAGATRDNSRLAFWALVWALYWVRSRRVALVFGRREAPADSPSPTPVQTGFSLDSPSVERTPASE